MAGSWCADLQPRAHYRVLRAQGSGVAENGGICFKERSNKSTLHVCVRGSFGLCRGRGAFGCDDVLPV